MSDHICAVCGVRIFDDKDCRPTCIGSYVHYRCDERIGRKPSALLKSDIEKAFVRYEKRFLAGEEGAGIKVSFVAADGTEVDARLRPSTKFFKG